MSMRTEQATVYTCDGCGSEFLVRDNDEAPLGFHGEAVSWIHSGGGTGCADWFACRAACIKRAIENAIARENER